MATTQDKLEVPLDKQAQSNISQQPTSPSTREDLVATAVTFLQNPKVRQSPFAQRKAFLERKGLTAEEIGLAVEKSGTAGDENVQQLKSDMAVVPVKPQLPPVATPTVSAWTRLRDAIGAAVFLSGASYGLYQFYKIYLAPVLFGKRLKKADEFDALTKSIDELRKTVTEVVSSIVELQRQLTQSHEQMVLTIKGSSLQRDNTDLGLINISDLKDEIRSVKSLLVSRSQFPSTPAVTPVIPAWQLQRSSLEGIKQTDEPADRVQSRQMSQDTTTVENETEKQKTSNTLPTEYVENKRDLNDTIKDCQKNGDASIADSDSYEDTSTELTSSSILNTSSSLLATSQDDDCERLSTSGTDR